MANWRAKGELHGDSRCRELARRREEERMKVSRVALVLLSAVVPAAQGRAAPAPQGEGIGVCKPYTWLFGGWVAPKRIPLLGDINGDGYADFLYASPQDRSIDVSLNGRGWKPLRGQRLLSGLPQEIRAICLGHFGGKTLDLAALGTGGGVRPAPDTPQREGSDTTP